MLRANTLSSNYDSPGIGHAVKAWFDGLVGITPNPVLTTDQQTELADLQNISHTAVTYASNPEVYDPQLQYMSHVGNNVPGTAAAIAFRNASPTTQSNAVAVGDAAGNIAFAAGSAAAAKGNSPALAYQGTQGTIEVAPNSGGANRTTSGFISDLHSAIQENINVGELAQYKTLDPDAKIGLTGSSATGTVGNPNKATFGQPIDPNNFDLDLFVQSDTLLDTYGTKLQAAPDLRQSLVDSYPDLFQGLKPGKDGLSIKFRPTGQPPNGSIMFGE
jgi:hypothetical protein